MNRHKHSNRFLALGLAALLLLACSISSSGTSAQEVGIGDWLEGHFFSIKVASVETSTRLDGVAPVEDLFVIVEVQWKANDLKIKQAISGVEFQLVDEAGVYYDLAGMIFDSATFKAHDPNAKFDKGGWIESKVTGESDNTYLLVFDVPTSARGLSLWWRHLPTIDLELD